MTESKKYSEYYADIFSVYLKFSPEYRRSLIDLNEMFDWIKEINLNRVFYDEYDFFIFMEWLNAINLVKPFCILEYSPEKVEEMSYLFNIGEINFKELFDEGFIKFPEKYYDKKLAKDEDAEPWHYLKPQKSEPSSEKNT